MSRMRDFLVGLFTRHLGAKLLALLLAIGLFGFVQSSLTGTQEVARVELRFRLADELRAKFVILTETRTLTGLTITGLRSKVDLLAKALAEKPEVPFTVDQRFLDDYAELPRNLIPITAEIFRDDPRFKDITVGNLPGDLGVAIDELAERLAAVKVAPDTRLTLPPDHNFQGTGKDGQLEIQFAPGSVKLLGPERSFKDPLTVFVSLPRLAEQLSRHQMPGAERGTATIPDVTIRWDEALTDANDVRYVRCFAPELGGEPIPALELRLRLVASCQVMKRKDAADVSMPIVVRYGQPPEFDLQKDWRALANPITKLEFDAGQRVVKVRLPKGLNKPEFTGRLVLVLDVANAKEEFGRLRVPLYLDLRERRGREDLDGLAQVEIEGDTVAEFEKKNE